MNKCIICFVVLSVWCSAVAQEIDWSDVKPKNVQVPMKGNITGGLVPRIVGGRVATRGQFPYQAALFMDSRSFCGGSLITRSVVLTAAHCTFGHRWITVYLGAHMIRDSLESTRVIFTTSNHTAHPRYRSENRFVDFDIAVVRLPTLVTFTDFINIVRLPTVQTSTSYKSYVDYRARVSGWGLITDGTTVISPVLNYVDVTVMTNVRCKSSFSVAINPDKLCVATTGGMSPCNGDSGGPLVIQESDRKYTQIGIVSFGSGRGCSVGAPSVFTRVTSYLDNFLASYTQ